MDRELANRFNEDIERYRRSLLQHARKCDWDTFKAKAGSLFDYVEAIELSEIERRFFRIFRLILAVLVAVVIAIANMDVTVHPDLQRVRYTVILLGIAGSCFEVYYFIGFRTFMEAKSILYKKRKDRFIKNIEQDFRELTTPRTSAG